MKVKSILIYSLVLFTVVACKTKQQVPKQTEQDYKKTELIEKISRNQPVFSTANVSKMSLLLDIDGRSFNVAASCKIRTDSAMHISIQPAFGIEMFKIEITPDSIRAYDKLNKRMYVTGFQYLETKFGLTVNYHDLQSMLSNQFFTIGSKDVQTDKCKVISGNNGLNAISYENNQLIQNSEINNEFRIQKTELKSKTSNYTMSATYNNFVLSDNILFPQKINVKAFSTKHSLNSDFNISRVIFNNKIVFSTLDPSKYDRAELNQLMTK